MRIKLFGNLKISFEGRPLTTVNTNRLQSLIAYLILHGDAQPRERLAFSLWPGSSESQARTNLRQLIHYLKRALPAEGDLLETTHFTIRWRQDDTCSVDVIEFQKAIAEAASARNENDAGREIQALTTAAQLYDDDLLSGLYDDWLGPIRDDYRARMIDVLHRVANLFEQRGDFASAIVFAERLHALDPVGESHYQLLIRLHAANQDRASALRAYHQCRRILRRELGVEPGPATVKLFEEVLKSQREPALSGRASEPAEAKSGSHLRNVRTLIGRAEEWHQLTSAWESAAEAGPRVAVISGEPGIGKTRLADELYQACLHQGHAAVRARCFAGQGQVSYAPVAEWLRSDAVRGAWPSLKPTQVAELARLIPEIAEQAADAAITQPSLLAERWQRLRFHESISSAIRNCRQPLLLYLDDMQWCDADSFEWLNAFLTSPAQSRILLLGTVRAEETEREHPFTHFLAALRQAGIVSEIHLDSLNVEETAELARLESTNPMETGRLEEIFRATRGNPLFVLETVRAGLQSTRVHAVIAARLGQLTSSSYELAGLASVVGRPFSFELLQEATDWDEASLSNALDELWRRRIIESSGTSEYEFTHDRLREVAYQELTLVRRRYLHRRMARALAEVHRADVESWNGQIASHLELAGMAEEAIAAYERASAYAHERYAETEAADLLRRALALCRAFPESANRLRQELHLLVTLGPALVTTAGYSAPEVGDTYHHALELSRKLGNRHIFTILSGTWVFHAVRGDLAKALQYSLECLEIAQREPAPGVIMAGNFVTGACMLHLGRLEESLRYMKSAIAAHDDTGKSVLALFAGPDLGVFCRSYLSHITWHRQDGDYDAYATEAIAAAGRIHDPFSQTIALLYNALLYSFQGKSGPALQRGREALAVCSRYGFAYYLAVARIVTGWAMAAEGDAAAGLEELRQGLDALRPLGAELRVPYYFALLAETLGRAGMPGEGLASLSNGFAFASKNGEQWPLPELHRVQGELLAAQGNAIAARESFERGIEAARRSGSVAFEKKLSILAHGTIASAATERS
jgi:DNA-binding SARP family transcriptional activator